MRPKMVHSYEGSGKYNLVEKGKVGTIDKSSCVNLLTPARIMSKNISGMALNSCLVEIWKAIVRLLTNSGQRYRSSFSTN